MNTTERISIALRHNRHLKNAHLLWNVVRPVYNRMLARRYRHGLERVINGTDRVLISIRARDMSEEYEPDVWASLMNEVRPGDTIADVGAFFGLYAIALAKRVGPSGRVVAFEPSSANHAMFMEHIRLNRVKNTIKVVQAAVGTKNGRVSFQGDNSSESHVVVSAEGAGQSEPKGADTVEMVTLDSVFAGQRLDILKIDVEGFEEQVMQGARELLSDPERGPRVLYIEVHPFAWHHVGTTSESLLSLLHQHNFQAFFVDGTPVTKIEGYGEIIARRALSPR